ncbi:NUMOD3 domain-containing DNA-binding protein [Halospeciosus flavus]|uniref:NUMOD3 domain-containing DNA-binding protein n=1 Tax=Halospeciosus flavus TaxID=3032283 RepID=A0ABD5Z1L3_9EURY|nr:NUMOD3 domain-containing DNA-binding protein [Halospeciosus flavus]
MVTRYRNGWWLEQKYHREGWTQKQIADECAVSPRTIRKYMDRFGVETRDVRGENHGLYGETRSEETKAKISASLTGRDVDDAWRERIAAAHRGTTLPEDVRTKISETLEGREKSAETRRKMSESTAGEKNPAWRGGHGLYYGSGWTEARERVRDRDEVCQHCGNDGSDHLLDVHHLAPVRLFIESDDHDPSDAHFDENLVLLCRPCHIRAEWGAIEEYAPMDSIPDRISEA